MEKINKGLAVPKWVLIVWPKIPQAPQNLSVQFVCPSLKVLDFNKKKASYGVRSPCCLALQCNATLSNLLFLTQRKPDSAWWSMHQRSKETKLARRRLIQGRTFSDFQFLAKKFYTETPIRLSNCKTVGRSINFWESNQQRSLFIEESFDSTGAKNWKGQLPFLQ